MTDQEINEAIAEAIGARFFTEDGGAFWHFVTKDGREFGPPTKDLNAMHEAENNLRKQGTIWVEYEFRINKCDTARQRAEAFLRTIGKWRDA